MRIILECALYMLGLIGAGTFLFMLAVIAFTIYDRRRSR